MAAAASLTSPSSVAPPPASELEWRSWAESRLAVLEQALAAAQAQLADVAGATGFSRSLPAQGSPAPELLAQHPYPILQLSAGGQLQYANAAAIALAAQGEEAVAWNRGPLLALTQAVLRTNEPQQQKLTVAGHPYLVQATPLSSSAVALYLTTLPSDSVAEVPLGEQPDFYETILQQLPVEVAVFDAARRYRFVNVTSIEDEDMRHWVIGRDDQAYCEHAQRPPALAMQRQQCFEQALHTRTPVRWEEVQQTAAGTQHMRRHFLPVFAADGTLRMMVGMGEDITERRLVEKQLAEQRAFYEFVLDQLPCDVGVFDDQFRYLFVNASGIKDPEMRKWIIGKDNFDYFSRRNFPAAMAQERHAQLEQVARERRLVTYEETFVRPQGTRHQYRCLQPVFHPDGSLHLILGYGLDVTERVVTEQALRHAKLAAESAVRAREIFLANMSHEIRTPMNAILGMSQLLAKTPLTPTQSSYQQAITTSADNLLVIINDILDLSKLEAGKMVLEQVGFVPAQLLTQVEQTLHYKAEEKGLCLRTEVGPGLPPVLLGDPYRITQVLLNLAGNAIKFTEKGHVRISCEVLPGRGEATAGLVEVLFRVTDTGVGIDPEFLAHIFQEFSQEDASVTRKFGGTGLGLPICRNLVKLMGGEVQLESEKHRGTDIQFTLRLPAGTAQDLQPQVLLSEDSPLRQHLRHKQVLLVEDNRFNRQIAKTFLQQAQVQVTEAEHGAQAVALAQEQAFDLILMDIQMPVLDGYGATAALREQLQLTTPIVALTANAIKGEREKCLAAGMNGYLAKPFQEAELLQIVSEWVVPSLQTVVAAAPASVPRSSRLYQIDELLAVGQGDPAFVTFMLETFVESSQEIVQELSQGLRNEEVSLLKKAAHTLRPSLAHLRVQHLLPAVTELDQWPGGFERERLTTLTGVITQQLEEVMQQINQDLATADVFAAE